jgi:flagellar protein FlaI
MALLWLFVQYDRSILIAGKTGAGKTTTLNALSLFIPSNSKINTIEDTQELELPHENWQANTTRESGDLTDSGVEITMADLIQSALRKRPDRILVGEVRGDEAYNLFQSIRTGHPGVTTFHAPTFEKMVRRMTSGEIDLAAEQLTALDLVLLQDEIRLEGGDKVRRNKAIYEVKGFAGGDDTDTQDMIERNMITKWNAQSDTQQIMSASSAQLSKIKEINGWDDTRHEAAIRKRLIVLSGLIVEEIKDYKSVAATIQAAIIDPDQVLESIAHQSLSEDIDRFGEDIVNIDVEHEGDEENVERPEPSDEIYTQAEELIEQSRTHGVLSRYV